MVTRGDVWWVDFGRPRGSAPALRRPALVISSDRFNRSRIATVNVVPLTTNVARAALPGNVLVPAGLLPHDSVVLLAQCHTVDRDYLTELLCTLPADLLREVDAGLRLALDL